MNEIKSIIAVMKEGRGDRQLRATIAVTNILPDSPSNRQNAMAAGLHPNQILHTQSMKPQIPQPNRSSLKPTPQLINPQSPCTGLLDILVGMLVGYDQDKRLARLAVACLSNLSAEASLKNAIVMAGVVPLVSRHLESSGSKEGRAASAHAAATLWSLCIGAVLSIPHFSSCPKSCRWRPLAPWLRLSERSRASSCVRDFQKLSHEQISHLCGLKVIRLRMAVAHNANVMPCAISFCIEVLFLARA